MSEKHLALPIHAITDATSRILQRLPDWLEPEKLRLGKFGVANDTCLAIEIFRSTDAFRLGVELGNGVGQVRMSSVGIKKYLVFTDARAGLNGESWFN